MKQQTHQTLQQIDYPSSTVQSLRVALNNFNEIGDLDSELFNAELEKFMEDEKN